MTAGSHMAVHDVEVLFEYLEYRAIICCRRNNICDEVEHHLALAGLNGTRVVVLSQPNTHLNGYFFAKVGSQMGVLVNVHSVNDINAEDRITVAKFNLEVSWLYLLS